MDRFQDILSIFEMFNELLRVTRLGDRSSTISRFYISPLHRDNGSGKTRRSSRTSKQCPASCGFYFEHLKQVICGFVGRKGPFRRCIAFLRRNVHFLLTTLLLMF